MDNMSKYDAILVCNYEDMIQEWDSRSYSSKPMDGTTYYKGSSWEWDDPKLYADNGFGRMLQVDLNNWRPGFSARVTDFGKWVVVDVAHHNYITGRSAAKTFLVVFNGGPKGDDKSGGLVLSTNNKWRSISGVSQASSYIKSACAALESGTSAKL
jgi:hypothetical protein